MGLNKVHDKVSSAEFSGEGEHLLSVMALRTGKKIKLALVTPASSDLWPITDH